MIIHRVAVRDFRGIRDIETAWAAPGVTVIGGPNEAGKTSLAQAIDILFERKDRSSAQEVRDAKPVGRDVGSTVEVDATVGPFAFTYRKRYHRDPETVLRIETPVREQLTGDDAHERVEAILSEHLDVGLWKALRVQQGESLEGPHLSESRSLVQALDRAAGGRQFDHHAGESVFALARDESARYYTPTGRPRAPLVEADAALESASAEHDEARDALARLDEHVRTLDALRDNLAAAKADAPEDARRAGESKSLHEDAIARVREVARLEQADEAATGRLAAAEQAFTRRQGDADGVRQSEARLVVAEAEVGGVDAEIPAAEAACNEADARATHARGLQARADESVRACEAGIRLVRALARLANAEGRVRALRQAERGAEEARAVAAGILLTPTLLARAEAAHDEVLRQQARLDAGSARLRIEALKGLRLQGAAGETDLAAGASVEHVVGEEVRLDVAGVVRIHATPAAGVLEARQGLAEATARLHEVFEEVGVSGMDAARDAERRKHDAEREAERHEQRIDELLGGWSVGEVATEVDRERDQVGRIRAERGEGRGESEDEPENEAEAERRMDEARRDRARAVDGVTDAQARLDDARAKRDALIARREAARARAGEIAKEVARCREAIDRDRREASDEALGHARSHAAGAAGDAGRALADARRALAEIDEGVAREAAEAAEAAHVARQAGIREIDAEYQRVGGMVEGLAEQGLLERAERAERVLLEARRRHTALHRRAAAAKLLLDTLSRKRDEVRRAYRTPLGERIEALGRKVFGEDFAVEIGEDLQVETRTLNGTTLPFHALSGGTREQIGLLARLACASMTGGAPVVIDDALGFADRGRMDLIADVLAGAGEDAQVVILTCAPERYRAMSPSRTFRLAGGRNVRG